MPRKNNVPDWAKRASFYRDSEYPFVYLKEKGNRSFDVYVVHSDGTWEKVDFNYTLAKARSDALDKLVNSIEAHVLALHEGARVKHLRKTFNAHVCGAPYAFETVQTVAETTCKLCLAVVAEDMAAKDEDLTSERETVRQVREFNDLSKLVTGESATTEL